MGWWLLLIAIGIVNAQESCLSKESNPYLKFGTNTAYIFSKKQPSGGSTFVLPSCKATAAWVLTRNGAHNPEANEITNLQKLVDLKQNILNNFKRESIKNVTQRICDEDLQLLEHWEWMNRINLTFAGDLTMDGYMSAQQQARIWKTKYAEIFTNLQQDYLFKFVNDSRSKNTFKAFTEGLFGDQAESFSIARENNETLLRPYKFCPAWSKEIEKDDKASQRPVFESKKEFQEMIGNVSRRLGFNHDLQKEDIMRMYQMCSYNKAWKVEVVSPWCAAFSQDDLKLLEYAEDLDTYYKYGFGSNHTKNIGCTFVKDLLNFMEKHVEADTPQQPRALIHFTTAAMMLLTYTALEAHKDTVPLTADNYQSPMIQERKWTTSTMAPYEGTIGVVLYKCSLNGNFQVNEQNQILFIQNERALKLEGCRMGLCDWSLIKQRFHELINKCDLQFCNSATKLSGITTIRFAVIVFVFTYFVSI